MQYIGCNFIFDKISSDYFMIFFFVVGTISIFLTLMKSVVTISLPFYCSVGTFLILKKLAANISSSLCFVADIFVTLVVTIFFLLHHLVGIFSTFYVLKISVGTIS